MSEIIRQGRGASVEDLPPLYPVEAIVKDLAEESESDLASMRDQYKTVLSFDLMPHAESEAKKILWMIDFEILYRAENPPTTSDMSAFEDAFAQ